jgi:nanoRNase/pAp phosphatase (c-di-AMP/oligoRNAs hydrolase)
MALYRIIADIVDHKGGGVVSITHHNADLDAVASSIVLKRMFPWVRIAAYKGISQAGRTLLESLGEEMEIDPDLSKASLVIALDSSSPIQVSEGDVSSWRKAWIIDHHQGNDNWGERDVYQDEDRGACVEIMLQMAVLSGLPLTREMAVAGIAGIVADTGKFRFARPEDLNTVSYILEGSSVTVEDVLAIIEGEEYFDVSKKIAVLKSLRRVRYQRVGDQIIGTSTVGSFEAAAARGLLVVGCDVVFIGCQKNEEMRISSRAKPHIVKAGVNLGKFMEEMGKRLGAEGGGHDAAAGLNGRGNVEKALATCSSEMAMRLASKLQSHEEAAEPEQSAEADPPG